MPVITVKSETNNIIPKYTIVCKQNEGYLKTFTNNTILYFLSQAVPFFSKLLRDYVLSSFEELAIPYFRSTKKKKSYILKAN